MLGRRITLAGSALLLLGAAAQAAPIMTVTMQRYSGADFSPLPGLQDFLSYDIANLGSGDVDNMLHFAISASPPRQLAIDAVGVNYEVGGSEFRPFLNTESAGWDGLLIPDPNWFFGDNHVQFKVYIPHDAILVQGEATAVGLGEAGIYVPFNTVLVDVPGVPEPTGGLLAGLCTAGLLLRRSRRR